MPPTNSTNPERVASPKPFGWEVRVSFSWGSGKPDQTFHWRGCSEGAALRKGMMKRNADHIISVEPVTKEE